MDVDGFVQTLPSIFGGDLDAPHPVSRRFAELMQDVRGMASENKLALINHAAAHVASTEAYLEVGSWKGLSIIAAMLGNDEPSFHAIESFHGFGVDRDEARSELTGNLARWGMDGRLRLIEDNAFRALARPGWLARPIGAYFYDGTHDRLAQYLAFAMAEPLLADEALIIIDDTDWRSVRLGTDRYLASHDGYEELFDLSGSEESNDRWWNGVRVFAYRRARSSSGRGTLDVTWRRAVYLGAYEPATWGVARVARAALSGRPRLRAAATAAAGRIAPLVRRRSKPPLRSGPASGRGGTRRS